MSRDAGFWLQQVLNAIQLASFYVPLATAFALIQGITRRVFLSFGDMAMFASFAAVYSCFDAMLQGWGDAQAALIALAVAIACGAALGFGIARGIFGHRLIATSQGFMIASIGLSIALQETMRLQSMSRDVWIPPLFQGRMLFEIPGEFAVKFTAMTAVAIGVSLAAMGFFLLALRATRFGYYWRACEQSIELARLCGVNTERVIAWTFVAGAGLASVAGWISAISYGGTNFSTGLMMGFKAMFAAVVGGFGSVRGAVTGAIALACMEVWWSAVFSTTYRDVAVFAIIVLVLLLRPDGLAGIRERRESEVI
jgi:branched-chain amino acid transport system permease protein